MPAAQAVLATSPAVVNGRVRWRANFYNLNTHYARSKMATEGAETRSVYNFPREAGSTSHAEALHSPKFIDWERESTGTTDVTPGTWLWFRETTAHQFQQVKPRLSHRQRKGLDPTSIDNTRAAVLPMLVSPGLFGEPHQSEAEVTRALATDVQPGHWAHSWTGNPQDTKTAAGLTPLLSPTSMQAGSELAKVLIGSVEWEQSASIVEWLLHAATNADSETGVRECDLALPLLEHRAQIKCIMRGCEERFTELSEMSEELATSIYMRWSSGNSSWATVGRPPDPVLTMKSAAAAALRDATLWPPAWNAARLAQEPEGALTRSDVQMHNGDGDASITMLPEFQQIVNERLTAITHCRDFDTQGKANACIRCEEGGMQVYICDNCPNVYCRECLGSAYADNLPEPIQIEGDLDSEMACEGDSAPLESVPWLCPVCASEDDKGEEFAHSAPPLMVAGPEVAPNVASRPASAAAPRPESAWTTSDVQPPANEDSPSGASPIEGDSMPAVFDDGSTGSQRWLRSQPGAEPVSTTLVPYTAVVVVQGHVEQEEGETQERGACPVAESIREAAEPPPSRTPLPSTRSEHLRLIATDNFGWLNDPSTGKNSDDFPSQAVRTAVIAALHKATGKAPSLRKELKFEEGHFVVTPPKEDNWNLDHANSLVKDMHAVSVLVGAHARAVGRPEMAVPFRSYNDKSNWYFTVDGMKMRRQVARIGPRALDALRAELDPAKPDFGLMGELHEAGFTHCPVTRMPIFDLSKCPARTKASFWRALCAISQSLRSGKDHEKVLTALDSLKEEFMDGVPTTKVVKPKRKR